MTSENLEYVNSVPLPNSKWLQNYGHVGLVHCMKAHPELFKDIRQDWLGAKPIGFYVKTAEELAKKNGGILQSKTWLVKNRYNSLIRWMKKRPEFFKHIKQEWNGGREIEEHVKTAEELAKKNNGVLKNSIWLVKNGYSGLDTCIRKHPESFRHIKQEWKGGRSMEEHIRTAEKLAEENGGILYNSVWLYKNRHQGLSRFMRNHIEAFKHIKQEWKGGKNMKEHIGTAKELAKKNGGILQNYGWLKKNGYNGLAHCMKNYPEVFRHIKQLKLNSHGIPV